ncbi:type II secretion system F family protein [Nocardioides panacisoli]|uniref:Type II secretion system protein GspF domain-containing protein n=1 Tax=Nocardioides panacisoli TaxID=627624 RepID=A0ABP7IKN5_9ACTN
MTAALTAVAAVAAACAAVLAVPSRSRAAPPVADPAAPPTEDLGLLRRWRLLWAVLAGVGCWAFLGGPAAPLAGAVAAVVVWVVAGRLEPPAVRRRREEVRRDLPHVVCLLGAALRAGSAPAAAVDLTCRALPGAAADRLRSVAVRLELGSDPVEVWAGLAEDPALGPLGRTMARTHRTGAPVVAAVDRLGEDLAREARAAVEDRARAVGVRAAVPLGVCLLPAFLLLGIVPLVAGLAGAIDW